MANDENSNCKEMEQFTLTLTLTLAIKKKKKNANVIRDKRDNIKLTVFISEHFQQDLS
jgi:hypothetical protein